MKRRLSIAALTTISPLDARRLRREARGRVSASRARSQSLTLMLDWVPNADHVGIYQALSEGDFTKAGLNVHVQVPTDPAHAAAAARRRQGRRRDLLRARGDARAQPRPAARVGRGDRPEAAHVDHLARVKHIRTPRRAAARQDRRRRRHRLPARVPADDPLAVPACPQAGSRRSTSAPTSSRRCCPAASTRPSAATGTTRRSSSRQRGKHPNVIRMEQVGVPTYDELVLVVRRARSRRKPTRSARFVQALGARLRVRPRTTRRPQSPRSSRPTRDSTRSSRPRASTRRCRCSSRASAASRGAGRTRRSGTRTGSGCSTTT